MSKYDKIKEEIRNNLKTKNEDILKKIEEELSILENTDGINDVNNLQDFYDKWKKHHNKKGHKNDINSWTAWALGMTEIEPNGEFMPIRRIFARASLPDIDSDFDSDFRKDVYDYIVNKYGGNEYTSNTGTQQKLKFRATITRLIKALDIANAWNKGKEAFVSENVQKVNEILGNVPVPKTGKLTVRDRSTGKVEILKGIKDIVKHFKDFSWYVQQKYPDIFKHAQKIEGINAAFTVHPAGIVLSNTPLKEIAPLRMSKKVAATQFAYEELEKIGLIKFDILAISTLTIIKETVRLIKENYNIDIDVENIPLNDKKTFELYRSGNLTGVFQCESSGMRQVIKDMEADRFEDIMAAIALYRPGPMEFIPKYVARKKKQEKIDYFHPSIEKYIKPYLEETYGVLVYQESIMQICASMANFDVTDGYMLIKAVGKKKESILKRYKERFISGCNSNGIKENVADSYWEKVIIPFSNYGFNLAHACSYGYTSLLTCYLKANYPEEFMCAILNVENLRKKHDKVEFFESDLKNFNIKLGPKSINTCKVRYTITKKADPQNGILYSEISPSLMIKNVGYDPAKNISDNAPYDSLRDLAERTNSSVDKKTIESLYEAGFFNDIIKKYNQGKKEKLTKEKFVEIFASIREDKKKSLSKGIESDNIFESF